MSDLKLDSLRIQNFKTFKDLTVDRLGRVNLIVGKNNTGKTALLEALYFWAKPDFWIDYLDLLTKTYPASDEVPERQTVRERLDVLRHYFYGRPELETDEYVAMQVGEKNGKELNRWACMDELENVQIRPSGTPGPPYLGIGSGDFEAPDFISETEGERVKVGFSPVLSISISEGEVRENGSVESVLLQQVSSRGLFFEDRESLWYEAIKSGKKRRVLQTLQVIVEDAVDLNWVEAPSMDVDVSGPHLRRAPEASARRIPILQRSSEKRPVPLSTLGEGVTRTLDLALALVNAEDGMLLIDEFENGLHHTVQRPLWETIFDLARELNVQVFATTHSQDCIKAFRWMSEKGDEEESVLVQLRRKRTTGEVASVTADEEELVSAIRSGVDPR